LFFIVTEAGPSGAVSFTCETPVAALEKALALRSVGVADVLISDSDGLQYAPADFHRLLIEVTI
jgi:hypothetical protein